MDRDLSPFRPSKIWRRMPLDRRIDAASLFWNDVQSDEQQLEAVTAIASHMKFRPRSVVSLAPEKRAKYLAQLPTISDTIAARALVNYHLERQREMMGAFLDALGMAHENGLISEEKAPKPDAARIASAAGELSSKYPPDDVSLYFATLVSQDPETWEPLVELSRVDTGDTATRG
ncbi:MAG TPA: hypothetical protein VGL62_12065 [Vicinamibacterales bacterium]|jgi:hypothetical protein